MKKFFVLSVLLGGGLVSGAHSAPPIECPATIMTNQLLRQSVPGWEGVADSEPRNFSYITFYSGHPNQKASLVPDAPNLPTTAKWTLTRATPTDEFWLGCHYHNTAVFLAKRIPPKAKECVATYKADATDPGQRTFLSMTCK